MCSDNSEICQEFEQMLFALVSYCCVGQQSTSDTEANQQKAISYRDTAAITFLLDFLRRTPSLRVICL